MMIIQVLITLHILFSIFISVKELNIFFIFIAGKATTFLKHKTQDFRFFNDKIAVQISSKILEELVSKFTVQ